MASIDRILASPSYLKASEDLGLLQRDELRPVRLQLELVKPELIQREHEIASTIVVFGSARTPEPAESERRLEEARREASEAPDDADLSRAVRRAERAVEHSRYYDQAREFARIVSTTCQIDGRCDYVIVTGGGPGIMEAANRGAHDVGAKTVGLNIVLPHEQEPNPYITPDLCFQFRYFAIRKMHFLMRAKALVVLPGGFGTFDELFETLTLIQTGKVPRLPVILLGRSFWERIVDFDGMVEEGVISPEDLSLFSYAETAEEAWRLISEYHVTSGHEPPSEL
jgi:uncharacterized protein (TIGR00730 family)